MGALFYRAGRQALRYIRSQCLRQVVLHGERAAREGGYLLACTHVSHVEPFIVSSFVERQVFWIARIEFFRFRPFAWIMRWSGTFSINRQGVPISAIRTAVRIAAGGNVVGIFPEGGCVRGRDLAFRGGRIKQGVATIAMRAQVPIVPVVVLGTDRLNCLDPWLPARRGQIWLAFGDAIPPPPPASRRDWRAVRRALSARIEQAFVQTYQNLLESAGLDDGMTH